MSENASVEMREVREITIRHGLERVKWLARALNTDDKRLHMGAIHVREGYAWATDGFRLHISQNEMYGNNIPVGTWEIIRNNRKEVVMRESDMRRWLERYDLRRIFPKCADFKSVAIKNTRENAKGEIFARFIRRYPFMVDFDYYHDLFPQVKGASKWNFGVTERMNVYYSETDGQAPIVAHGDGYIGILMPILEEH